MSGSTRFIFGGQPNKGSQTQLLRPRMLAEYVFPNVGLIMYGFFWVKFGLWLHSQGVEPREQEELLLWTTYPDETVDYTESILYYSILLVYVNEESSNIPGKDITRDWLFARQARRTDQYEQIVAELEQVTQGSAAVSGERVTEELIAPWFRTRCREQGIDLPAQFEAGLEEAVAEDHATEREAMERGIEEFVSTIGSICAEHPSLYEKYNTNPISDPFDLTALLWEVETDAKTRLANRDVTITQSDVDALFEMLAGFPQGSRMLHSFCFMAYIGPADEGGDRLRDIHTICRDRPAEIIETAQTRLHQRFEHAVVEDIVATSFYYELNYVLAEGETIARKLLTNRTGLIRLEEIETFLEEKRGELPIDRFESFVESPESVEAHLPGLIEQYDAAGMSDVVAFLTRLQEWIQAGLTPAELLVRLLIQQETLSEVSDESEMYDIEQPPETTSPASFYGSSSMMDYTAELLRATAHE